MSTQDPLLPMFKYYLDESDPDVVILRRQDDAFVAAFSARGVSKEGLVEAAKEDYRQLVHNYWARRDQSATEEHRSA